MTARDNRQTTKLSDSDYPTIVLVGGADARGLVHHFDETATVVFVSDDETAVSNARSDGVEAHCIDVTVGSELASAAADADAAIVTLGQDRTALLASKLLQTCCDVDTVVASVLNPDYHDAFEKAGIEVIDTRSLLAGAVSEKLPPLEA